MKEHEIIYQCRKCWLLDKDKIKNFSRKTNLIKHLREAHHTDDGGRLASAWRHQVKKKYFSCGFCVSLFRSMTEQLNHIDNEHFKQLRDIRTWDFSNVIRGLLLQPGVDRILRSMYGSNYTASQGFLWDPFANQHLQTRLEVGQETPDALASAAINQGGHPSQRGQSQTNPTVGYSGLKSQPAPQSLATYLQNGLPPAAPHADSSVADPSASNTNNVPAEQEYESQGPDWFHSGLPYTHGLNTDISSGTWWPLADYQLPNQIVPPSLPPDGRSDWIPAPFPSWFGTQPILTGGYDGNNRRHDSLIPTEELQSTEFHNQSGPTPHS